MTLMKDSQICSSLFSVSVRWKKKQEHDQNDDTTCSTIHVTICPFTISPLQLFIFLVRTSLPEATDWLSNGRTHSRCVFFFSSVSSFCMELTLILTFNIGSQSFIWFHFILQNQLNELQIEMTLSKDKSLYINFQYNFDRMHYSHLVWRIECRINVAFVSHNWHAIIYVYNWHLFQVLAWDSLLCTFQIHKHQIEYTKVPFGKMSVQNENDKSLWNWLKTFIDIDKNENK